jgi:hypothetical protein
MLYAAFVPAFPDSSLMVYIFPRVSVAPDGSVTVPPFDMPMYESVAEAVYDDAWAVTTWDTTMDDVDIGFGMYELRGVTDTNVLVDDNVTVDDVSNVTSI